ncbi:ABC transporter ATPase [Pedobacter sp. P351]|uniref:ABC transporter ATPase n=1 Tax=Pedobacter superstes TaxID=3133441 RepID=UPI0030AA7008
MEISKNSRVWIYQSNRPFSLTEEHGVKEKLNDFTSQWQAHGNALTAKAEIRYNRFVILMVDEQQAGATGCSIDKSVNLMKHIEEELDINLFDRFNIAYRDENGIKSCSREEFEKLITEGKVTEDTIVFNNLVQTLAELEQNWEVPLKNSWHARVFGSLINA